MRRDVSEEAKKVFDQAQDTLKGIFTQENWNVSERELCGGSQSEI